MTELDISISPEGHRRNRYSVYIEVWAERANRAAFLPALHASSYCAIAVGFGEQKVLWGAGYSTSDDILRAMALKRVLDEFHSNGAIEVYAKGLVDQVKAPAGHVRAARRRPDYTNSRGQPFDGFEYLNMVATALDEGKLVLHQVRARQEPEEFLFAKEIAETTGKACAKHNAPVFTSLHEIHPRNHIVATDKNPDPYNLSRFSTTKSSPLNF